MRQIEMHCSLSVPAERLWEAVCAPSVLQATAWPVFTFTPLDPPAFPERWEMRDYRVRVRLFGVVPLGWQIFGPRYLDAAAQDRVLLDSGRSPLFRHWEHRVTLTPIEGGTRLTDRVAFDAGLLTRPAGLVLRLFFAHRHRRLRSFLENED